MTPEPGQSRAETALATTVLIIDDHLVFAQLLARALSHVDHFVCLGTATSVTEGFAAVREHRPDVVVMDVRLGDGDGVSATAILTDEFPELRVVILSAYVDAALLSRAATAGACALVPKNGDLEEMLGVLRSAERGGFSVPPRFLRSLMGASPPPPDPGLTAREVEVLRMLAAGVGLGTIAQELGISVNTARGHVKNLLAKLGAHSQLEAVVTAARRGLIHALPSS
ncbi:MAG: response regulator transcription factor [Actinomycetota bacterium]|nr:response regulator transcription factor [Actinomycetota bacterium]